MNILYISQYFPPEVGATQIRAYEMATNLVNQGHNVTMMTEMPNHPSGIIFPGYRGKFRMVEEKDGLHIVRSWVKAAPIKTLKTRMHFYTSFMITTIINSLFLGRKKYDIVYATSPPLFVGMTGLIISKIKRIPFVFEVRDLWPESAVILNQLNNVRYIKMAHHMANLCYSEAKAIVGVTNGICDELINKNIPEQKLFLVRNATNPKHYCPMKDSDLEARLKWKNKFVVLYSGIHGVAQGLKTVIDAASLVKHFKDIHFAFIGEGPRKASLQKYAAENMPCSVEFLPEVPFREIPKYISLASVCLVPLKKRDLFKGALPTKLFDFWACGKPVLLSVDGEARRELEKSKAGIYVEPENSTELARGIITMHDNRKKTEEMGNNGRQYILNNGHIRSIQAEKLAAILHKCKCE